MTEQGEEEGHRRGGDPKGGGARESTVWSSKERPPSYRGGCGRDSTSISCSEVVNRVVTSSRQSFPPCGHCSRVVQERVMSTCVSVYLDNWARAWYAVSLLEISIFCNIVSFFIWCNLVTKFYLGNQSWRTVVLSSPMNSNWAVCRALFTDTGKMRERLEHMTRFGLLLW